MPCGNIVFNWGLGWFGYHFFTFKLESAFNQCFLSDMKLWRSTAQKSVSKGKTDKTYKEVCSLSQHCTMTWYYTFQAFCVKAEAQCNLCRAHSDMQSFNLSIWPARTPGGSDDVPLVKNHLSWEESLFLTQKTCAPSRSARKWGLARRASTCICLELLSQGTGACSEHYAVGFRCKAPAFLPFRTNPNLKYSVAFHVADSYLKWSWLFYFATLMEVHLGCRRVVGEEFAIHISLHYIKSLLCHIWLMYRVLLKTGLKYEKRQKLFYYKEWSIFNQPLRGRKMQRRSALIKILQHFVITFTCTFKKKIQN